VRSYAPGAEVRLAVIREGKPQVLTAKLAERHRDPVRVLFSAAGGGEVTLAFPDFQAIRSSRAASATRCGSHKPPSHG
jgi:hypothetical protein